MSVHTSSFQRDVTENLERCSGFPNTCKYNLRTRKRKRSASCQDDLASRRPRSSESREPAGELGPARAAADNTAPHPLLADETRRLDFEAKYCQSDLLARGGHASVYTGYRRVDHAPVAIKRIPRKNIFRKSVLHRNMMVPSEVVVMDKVACGDGEPEGRSITISLLDYYELQEELVLVLERPVPVSNLRDYAEAKGGFLQDEEAKIIFKQLVEAAAELDLKSIFHRDIKVDNILIDTSSGFPRLRLIDFGLSCFTKKSSWYTLFYGTSAHIPPEWYSRKSYRPGPTTVWQMGIVLYEMLHDGDNFETRRFLKDELKIRKNLPLRCQEMLHWCLAKDPKQRPTLAELLLHPWLTASQEDH
ncbi:serine/threonine-protein kinase pim-2-like [Synchiropus picturatus]